MHDVSYQDQTLNATNPIARYAHRSRLRRSLEYAERLLQPSGRLLDFGCGTGDFLRAFKARRPDARLIGFEPYLSPGTESFSRVSDMETVNAESIDVLCCFEVLEHLSEDAMADFVRNSMRVLKSGGVLLVSVPIIGGLTLLLKESNRMILFGRKSEYSVQEFLRATFLGVPGNRSADRRVTHKGFDFRTTRHILADAFAIIDADLCPFTSLPWWVNSQAFFMLRNAGHRRSIDLSVQSPYAK